MTTIETYCDECEALTQIYIQQHEDRPSTITMMCTHAAHIVYAKTGRDYRPFGGPNHDL